MNDYKCVTCNGVFGEEEWNKTTEEKCGKNIARIEGAEAESAHFICPGCGDLIHYYEFDEDTLHIPHILYHI